MSFHSAASLGAIHILPNWTYDTQAARESATGFVTEDLYKVAVQLDNNTAWLLVATTPTWTNLGGATSHAALSGLPAPADDHTQYMHIDGRRSMTGNLSMGSNAIVSVGNVDGRDVSADGSTLDSHVASTSNPHSVTASQVSAIPAIASPAHGDIIYRDASSWTRLAAGTSGQFLQTNGSGSAPSWVSGGTGAVHVASGVSESESSTTSSSFQQKLRVTTPSLTNGLRYLIQWYCEIGKVADEDVEYQVQLNDTTTIATFAWKNHPYSTRYTGCTGIYFSTTLSGVVNIDIDWSNEYGFNPAYIRRARVIVLQVP